MDVVMERPPGGGAEPLVPVEPWWNGFGGQVAGLRRAPDAHPDRLDLSEPPAADELACFAKVALGPLLAPRLKDAAVTSRGVDHRPALPHGERKRLLAIDILPRLAGLDRCDRMPVVRYRDDHGVDVFAVEQFPVVVVFSCFGT